MENKKVIFSGIKPSGDLTLGNYLGAIKNWVKLQDEDKYECFYCVVDMHAITVKQDPKELRRRTMEILALYIASGIDPEKNTMFIQSHVPTHSELAWVLACNSYMGELNRMTQYKDKAGKSGESIGVGLFTYPILMASDILLYGTELVPVGKDQIQHLELARDIAVRFNNAYSDTFKIPEGYVNKSSAKIMDLQYPEKKMSKSDENPNGSISIMDDAKVIRKKISRAVTDTVGVISYNDEQPGIKNLINIVCSIKGCNPEEVVAQFEGKGYADFKAYVGDTIVEELEPIQNKVKELMGNKKALEEIYRNGAQKATYVSNKILRKVMKKVGFIPR